MVYYGLLCGSFVGISMPQLVLRIKLSLLEFEWHAWRKLIGGQYACPNVLTCDEFVYG